MAFRGIGDDAIQVIKEQNQLGMQAAQLSENARQFDEDLAEKKEARAEAAAQTEAQMRESTRQFDVSAGIKMGQVAEGSRQFDLTRQDANAQNAQQLGMGQEKFDWQKSRDKLSADLDILTSESNMATQDANRQMLTAQLAQFKQATSNEQNARANRENVTKGAFYGLFTSALLNGGASSSSANALMKQQLGLTKGDVYAVADMNQGLIHTFITDDNGQQTMKTTPAELFYQNYADDMGEAAAKPLYNFWTGNRAVQARIQAQAAKSKATGAGGGVWSKTDPRTVLSDAKEQIAALDDKIAEATKGNSLIVLTEMQDERARWVKIQDNAMKQLEGAGGGDEEEEVASSDSARIIRSGGKLIVELPDGTRSKPADDSPAYRAWAEEKFGIVF